MDRQLEQELEDIFFTIVGEAKRYNYTTGFIDLPSHPVGPSLHERSDHTIEVHPAFTGLPTSVDVHLTLVDGHEAVKSEAELPDAVRRLAYKFAGAYNHIIRNRNSGSTVVATHWDPRRSWPEGLRGHTGFSVYEFKDGIAVTYAAFVGASKPYPRSHLNKE